jgi:hypothetical protein
VGYQQSVNLSVVASGTGGFVINGENAGDLSGSSVSTAGDVNGDGLAASKEPTIKSSKPSPLTSPAVETQKPLLSYAFSPLITKPPVPIADRLIAVLSVLI